MLSRDPLVRDPAVDTLRNHHLVDEALKFIRRGIGVGCIRRFGQRPQPRAESTINGLLSSGTPEKPPRGGCRPDCCGVADLAF
jgi:hypothetical protein